jgi:hypothetical protein
MSMDDEQLKAVTVGDLPPEYQEAVLEDWNAIWPHWYECAAYRIPSTRSRASSA